MTYYKSPNNKLHWLDDDSFVHLLPSGSVPITESDVDTIREEERIAAQAALTYAQKRAVEYPPMTDYLDGIAKGNQTQIDKYIADCLAVKAKYPRGA